MKSNWGIGNREIVTLGFALSVGIFLVDLKLPLGICVWVFYLIPVLVGTLQRRANFPISLALFNTILTIVGFFYSPPGVDPKIGALNRSFGLVLLWVIALVERQLIAARNHIEDENWLNNGLAQLYESTRGRASLSELGAEVLDKLCPYVDAAMATFYVVSDMGLIHLEGSFAGSGRDRIPQTLRLGEGLAGQAALSKRPLRLNQVPNDYFVLASSTGQVPPRTLLVVPLVADGHTRAVIELGFLGEPVALAERLMLLAGETIAMSVQSLTSRQRLETLLTETQRQSEELAAQQEELSAANADLEQRSHEMQVQQEELAQSNAELEEQRQRLEEQNQRLGQKNEELTLAKRDIEEKGKALATANRYKSEFLANMSHELRTPLNSILILSKLLTDFRGDYRHEQAEMASTIHSASTDLLNLISDILDLSKVEAGKLEIIENEIRISKIVDDLSRPFLPQIESKGLKFTARFDDESLVKITTDKVRLEQILKNFLSNAVKFTAKGSIELSVSRAPDTFASSLSSLQDSKNVVAFSVKDTGIGIPPMKQQLIFEAFQQVDGSISRRFGGTGLGLTISRELATLLGGEIRMSSEFGKGSVFTVYLPLGGLGHATIKPADSKDHQAPPVIVDSPRSPATQTEPAPLRDIKDDRYQLEPKDKRIAIIEDDLNFAKILLNLCHEHGFKAIVSTDGESGLADVQRYLPQAIILDIRLPKMSGLEVLNRLKLNPKTRHIPVEVLSVEERQIDVRRLGAVDFVSKPISREKLNEVLTDLNRLIETDTKSVLIIEDNAAERKSLQLLVGNGIVKSTAVASAAEAIDEMRKVRFDCIILDLHLPDMSGFDLLDKIKNDENLCCPPVIVYTGKDLSREEESRLQEFSDSIIIKGAKSPERLLSEVTLFLHRVEDELPEDQKKMLESIRHREDVFEGKKILVADDDMRNIFALRHALLHRGFEIVVAKTGREAVELLDQNSDISLVLMDVMMPEMDGYEAMTQIRRDGRFKRLPIIALTAKAMKGDREKCLDAGASDYLAKPLEVDSLLSLLRIWLS